MPEGNEKIMTNGRNNDKHNKKTVDNEEISVVYSEKDPIKLFRMPIDREAGPGFRVIIQKKMQKKFFDPINSNSRLSMIEVRKIFSSNAKPYLIDCFVGKSSNSNGSDAILSSSFILKQGDDLRKGMF